LNYRLTEIQAAIGRVQLSRFAVTLEKRRALVREYCERLRDCADLQLPAAPAEHTWQTFMPVLPPELAREPIVERLASEGIQAGPGSVAAHLGQQFQPQKALPHSEILHHQGLALPLFSDLTEEGVHRCATSLRLALKAGRSV
jgi:perosamine synthetase